MRRLAVVVPSMLSMLMLAACVDLTKPEDVADCALKKNCTNGVVADAGATLPQLDAGEPDSNGGSPIADGGAGYTDALFVSEDGGPATDAPVIPDAPTVDEQDAPVVVAIDGSPDQATDARVGVRDAPVRIDVPPGACAIAAGQPAPAGTICRPAVGPCDVAETCDGASVDCPDDKLAAAGKECRAVAGDCDVEETCTGTSVECPDDGFKAVGTVCRAAAGVCDYAETCSGLSPICPVDSLKPSTYACNASTGACDPAESCTGTGVSCPADTVLTAPSTRPTIVAQSGTLSVSVSWSAVVGATGYNLKRGTTSGGPYATIASNLLASESPYLDQGLDSTKTYYYVLSAINTIDTCESADSLEVSAQPTGVCSKPAAPVVTATAGNGQVSLSWPAVAGASNGYDVARSQTSSTGYASIARVTTGTSYVDTTVQFGKTYYYQVTTLGTCNSDPSAVVSATPLCTPAAAAPTGLTASAPNTGGVVVLSWTGVPGATTSSKYEVLRKLHTGTTYVQIDEVTSPTTANSDTTVSDGTSYDYVVTYNNGTCTSPYSNVATVTPTCVMDKPVLTVTPGNQAVDLSWTAPANGSLTGYKVYRKDTGSYALVTTLTGAGSTTYSDTGLSNGTTYTYYVTATGNCSADSAPKTAAPVCTPLAAPSNLKATAGDTQVTLSWDAVTGADHYTVKRASATGGPYTALVPASPITTNSYADMGLSNGTTYYYVVTASNGTCDSSNSTEASAMPQTCPSQGAPGLPTLTITSSTQVRVEWAEATPSPSGGYNILRGTSATGALISVGTASTSPFVDASADLTVGTTYYYAVRAIGATCSNTSASGSIALTCTNPSAPSASITANSDGSIKVSWSAVTGATAYTVSRATVSGGPFAPIAGATNITAATYTDNGLTNATNYYYVVSASNANHQCVSGPSAQVSARSCIIPAAPTGLSARRTGNRQVTLVWAGSQGANSYYVQRSDGTQVRTTSGTTYTDNTATNASTYSYVLSAASDADGICSSGNTSSVPVPSCKVVSGGGSDQKQGDTTEWCLVTCDDVGWWSASGLGDRTLYANNVQQSTIGAMPLPTKANSGYAFYFTRSANGSGNYTYWNYGSAGNHSCP
jgi:fibronectin type 3 domain-containing protein